MNEALTAETVMMKGHEDAEIEAISHSPTPWNRSAASW